MIETNDLSKAKLFNAANINVNFQGGEINLNETGFAIIMEELYRAKFVTESFSEIPYELTARTENQGESKFNYSMKTCIIYLKYSFKSYFKHILKKFLT